MSMGAAKGHLRPELFMNGSRGLIDAVKPPGFVMSRGRRALGWSLLIAGVALVAWALSP